MVWSDRLRREELIGTDCKIYICIPTKVIILSQNLIWLLSYKSFHFSKCRFSYDRGESLRCLRMISPRIISDAPDNHVV